VTTTTQSARRAPWAILATLAILAGIGLVVLDLRGAPRWLWILPFGLATLLSGIGRGKRVEVMLGALVAVVGLVVPFLRYLR
jgi:hypothetical protein